MSVVYENPPELGPPLGKYSHLSRAGDLVLVAGQVGVRPNGSLAGDDLRSQLFQAFENLGTALESAGGGFDSVMKLTTYLVGESTIEAFREARNELYARIYPSGMYPPNTLLVVQALVRPDLLLEIDAMASIPISAT
ncbi:MAG: RidA family protein [Chloroflexi bacterium]|nr:RidA family protein [Chloroflexota bacterium]